MIIQSVNANNVVSYFFKFKSLFNKSPSSNILVYFVFITN